MSYLVDSIVACLFFTLALYLHEYGHYWVLRQHFQGVKIYWERGGFSVGKEWMYKALKNPERMNVYATGILLGLAPLFLLYFIVDALIWLVAIILYAIGSWNDLKMMWCLND